MEQLSLTAGKEKENVVQILTDLMEHNREFQIMITVPPELQAKKTPWNMYRQKKCPNGTWNGMSRT